MAKKNNNSAQEEKKTNAGASSQTAKLSKPNMTIEKSPAVVYTPTTQTKAQTSQKTKVTTPAKPNLTVQPMPTSQSSQTKRSSSSVSGTVPSPATKSSGTKNWTDRAANSVIAYDQGGRVNAWQTALNVINGLKTANTKALSNQKYSDRFNDDVLNEYKARGGKTIFGKATNADLYNQIEDELTPNYTPAKTSYERAKLPQSMTKDEIAANATPAWFLAANYDTPTAAIADSRTRGNTLGYLSKYEDMSFGEKVRAVPGNTVANYGLNLENTGLTDVNALTGGKLGNGELGKASTVYSALNFAQDAGSGLTEQAFNSMLETSNWFEKIILQLERTAIEQLLDITIGAATGGTSSLISMGARVFGAGAQEAENKGKGVGEQVLTGGIRSGIEIGTELLGGVGGSWRGTGYGDAVFDSLDKWVGSKTNKEMLGTLASAFGSEATEEMLSDVLNPLADRIFNISDGDQTFWQEVWGDGQLLYDGLLGGLAGLGGGLGTSISNASTAKYLGVDVATYKAAQRIAGDKKLREKYEQYTGEQLQENEQAAIMQIASGLTNAASDTETSTREVENSIRNYQAPTSQDASESPVTNASTPTSTYTTTAQNSTQTPAQGVAAGLGDMTAIYNGSKANVVGMVKMENGQYAARIERSTPSGTKVFNVTEDKLTFDPETKYLMDMVRPYEYADEMLVNYDAERNGGDKSLPAYVQAFNIVADILGKQSTLTEEEARAWVQKNKGLSATLSDSQFEAAFRAGRSNKDAHVQNSATRQGGTGKLIFGKDVNYDGTQYKAATSDMISEAEREVLQTVAKAAGVDMFFYQSESVDGKYQGANGFYRKGTVYLDVNAGANQTTEQSAVLLTAAHELTHYLRENNAEGYAELRDFVVTHLMQDGADIEAMAEKMIRREGSYDGSFTLDDAVEEIVADSCEMMLQNTQLPQIMAQENPSLYAKVKDWLRRFVDNLRRAFEGVEARSPEARAMMQYAGELQQLWDNALADTAAKPREKRGGSNESKSKNSFRGYDKETGKAIYEANFPKGTPRKAKAERILNFIQNVWSKKPITLVVKNEDGSTRKIEAQFDPSYNEAEGKVTDAAKLMGGNRHGTGSEQRVTLDLADDYYDIAADSTYNYSKTETGKDKITHEGVKQWHYFINDILFQEYGEKETTPYRVTINVKERSDGQFVYSFNAEKESPSTRQTLHADVTHNVSDMSNARTSDGRLSQSDTEVNSKFSRRSSDTEVTKEQTREQQMSRAELLRELEAQKQKTEYWRKQSRLTKENTVRKTDTHKFAREMAEQLDVKDKAAIAEFEDAAQYIGDYIVQSTSETMDYDTLHSLAVEAADVLLNKSEVEIESGMEEQFTEISDYIRKNKLKVNETELKDMPEGWLRQHRQFIKLSPDGVPIDVAWQQWQSQYGEGTFPSDITAQSDMLYRLADIEQGWRTRKGNPFAENMGEMREAVAQEIIDTMLSDEIRQTAPTAMDRAKAKADKRYSEMKQAERQRANERIAKVLAEGKARTREAVKAERTFQLQRTERVQKTKSIEKLRGKMIKKLTDNTGKSHVPDILKEPVAQLLQSIDPTTTRTRQAGTAEYIKSLEKLQDVLENQRLHSQHSLDGDVKDATGADLYFDIPDGFAQQIKEYVDDVKHWGELSKATTFKLEEMNLQELHDLENILKVVNGAVNKVNEMYTSSSTVSEVSEGTMKYLDKLQPKTKATNSAEKFLGFTNQTPVYFFERMGETGAKIFKYFTDGWDKFAFYTEEILNFTETLYSRKEVREAERDIRTVQLHNVDTVSGLTNENTVPVQMTRAQIMNLYGATVRGEQSINHILGGGIKLTSIKDEHGLKNPKNILDDPRDLLKKSKEIVQPETYHLNMQELSQIISDNLTARDKEIVDKMIKFLSGPIAQWGNAVSQKRWGIDLFTEENYWPIGTDRNSRPVSNMDSAGNSASIYRLANMGFTKPLTPGANNPMIIGSAFDVFANHAADMAKYGSLVLPMLDAMKWINYSAITETGTETITLANGSEQTVERYSSKSVRKSMDRVYGHDAQDYFVHLMRDLNGSREGGRDAQNGLEKWTSNYKRQAVAANLRVMLLQPTSFIRAGNVLKLADMAAGLNQFKVKQNYEEAIENSGIAKWKDLGFYDTNINASMRTQIKHDESTADQVVDWTMKGAEMGDKWTWSMLWGASKHDVESKAKRAGETLTHDELMQRTNDLFTEVIYKTQVVDSPLTRSQLMRSDDKLNRSLTSFMAEPTLTYNVLAENVNAWQREASVNGRAAANKKLGGKIFRNMMVYCAGSIVSAAVESFVDALRDDDEYESFWDKYKEKFLGEDNFWDGNLWDELNPLSKLPIIKDIVGIVSGDSSSNMALEGFENAYSFIAQFNQKIKYLLGDPDAEDIKLTDWGLAYQGLKAVSQLSGIPGTNATRDVIGIWNTLFAPSTGNYIHTYKQNPESSVKLAYLNGYVDEEEALALLMDKETMGDKVYFTEHAAKVKLADWTTGGVDKMYDELYTAMENDDRAAFDAAMNALTEDGMRYRYDVISNVRSTIKEWYTGDEHGATKLNKDMAEKMLVEYGGYTTNDAHTTVHQLTCKIVEGFSYTQRKELFLSGDLSYNEAVDLVQAYGKDDDGNLLYDYEDKKAAWEEAKKEVQKWQMALDTNIDYDNIRSAYDRGEISDAQLEEYLEVYGSKEKESAENTAYLWKWKEGDEVLNSVTSAQARRYDNYIVGAGIDMSKEQYANYIDGHLAGDFHGDLKPGSTDSYVPLSKRNKIWAYIDTLPLTPEGKDAMAVVYAYDYEKNISPNSVYFDLQDAPWNN